MPQPSVSADCAGCVAPCCTTFTMGGRFQALVSGVVRLRHWRMYDTELRVIAVERREDVPLKMLHFARTELDSGRCTI